MQPISLRPAWLEIDQSAIENNARRLKEIIGPDVELMAMVKASAYGHGAIESARAAVRGGATWLGVYAVGEGVELRAAGITTRILVTGPTLADWVRAAIGNDLTLTLPSRDAALEIANAAQSVGTPVRVHLKVDTGMTRLGVRADEALALIRQLRDESGIDVEGLYTHFSVADDPHARGRVDWGSEYTRLQFGLFQRVLEALDRLGVVVRYRHASNSAGALTLPEAHLNLVRSGILMYGLDPSPPVPRPPGFQPALAFKTRLALVREVPRGTFVSYGAAYETPRATRIGVIMTGYADGFRRGPKNYGEVLLRGQRAPIIGRVTMDQTMIDVTDIPEARAGDEVVLIGAQGTEKISAEAVAEKLGTNNYEVVTTISARVPRLYKF